jgi:hypothetical protein
MRNSKPPKRPAGTTPEMEKKLRAEFSKFGKNQAIKSVNPLVGAMAGRAGLAALGRAMATSGPQREFEKQVPQEMRKFMEFAGGLRDNLGLRGQVRPVNSKEIADMARRYAENDKSVLQDIGKLTKRQQQMIRDEITRQYKQQPRPLTMEQVKSLARKLDRKLDPANTGRTGAIGVGIEEEKQTPTTQLDEVTIMKSKKYATGGALKPVPSEKKGLAKLPTEVRNKMGYMMGGGKLGMMYQNGGKTADQKFNANAKAREMENLTEMRNALKKSDPDAVAAFDRSLKAKGMMVAKKPVKKMANGGMLKKAGAPNPLNPTKDNNSYISNAVDMSPSTKKQMDALRQAMMYFTGVSPKNK